MSERGERERNGEGYENGEERGERDGREGHGKENGAERRERSVERGENMEKGERGKKLQSDERTLRRKIRERRNC